MAQATLSCPFGAIHLEMRGGPIPVSAFAERALTVILPPDPHYGRRPPERSTYTPGGQRQDCWSFLPRGHRPLRRRKVRSIPDAQAWASVMSLPCSSSPHQTRFAGLWRGPRLSVCAVRTTPALAEPWQLGNRFAPCSLFPCQGTVAALAT